MTTHEAWLTQLFNHYLAGPGNALLALFHLTAADPKEPWADFIVMQLLVAAIMIVLFLILRSRLSVDKPGKLQHLFELIHGFVVEQAEDQVGHHEGRHHVVLFETLFIFLLLANLIGIVPQFVSPTQAVYVPAGCALVAFLYYNIVGLKKNGPLKYGKHFLGPIPIMAPLMIPIEIISHLARPLSLTIRLFANMYAGEQVTLVFLSLTYLVGPAIFMGLHVFVSLLQAYIFVLLTMMYVAGAVAEEH
ncbi:MAG TPA: F0F1 ATP synthase subunit A [Bryobacteraceae bacterium]|nr:F0F1 ATP synthase subunit A [Bryobacteraceae bacterium]